MVEVFRTNVITHQDANRILACIHKNFVLFEANFDLEDCDKILRVKSITGPVYAPYIIEVMHELGFDASVLPDEELPTTQHLTAYSQQYFQLN